MPHSSERRWRQNQTADSGRGVANLVGDQSQRVIDVLIQSEELYQDLLEMYQYVQDNVALGSPANAIQEMADQLFYEDWVTRESDPIGNPGVYDTQANAAEVAKVQDMVAAITAMHQLYQAATNVSVSQSDRLAALRRMT